MNKWFIPDHRFCILWKPTLISSWKVQESGYLTYFLVAISCQRVAVLVHFAYSSYDEIFMPWVVAVAIFSTTSNHKTVSKCLFVQIHSWYTLYCISVKVWYLKSSVELECCVLIDLRDSTTFSSFWSMLCLYQFLCWYID